MTDTNGYGESTHDFTGPDKYGISTQRVELHPATDRWMMGDRYGSVVNVGRLIVQVKLDKSRKTLPFRPTELRPIRFAPETGNICDNI